MIPNIEWAEGLDCAITVCDMELNVIYMNNKSAEVFSKWGGLNLIGKSLRDCHNQRSLDIMQRLISQKQSNSYTIEKKGIKKIIHQTPWYKDGKVAGLVEISIELPIDMPHFVRE